MILWHNGAFKNQDDVFVSISDRGFTIGDGVFDSMLIYKKNPVFMTDHMTRFLNNAEVLKIQHGLNLKDAEKIILALIEKNDLNNDLSEGYHFMRSTITRGPGMRGIKPPENPEPTILIRVSKELPGPDKMPDGNLIFSQNIRRNEGSILSRIKSNNYADNILAMIEAEEKGANDALIMNNQEKITCATSSNVFVLNNDKLYTPPLEDGVLDGITRKNVIDIAHAMNIPFEEKSLSRNDIIHCESVFLTNAIVGVRRVVRIEDRAFEKEPEIFQKIRAQYHHLISTQ